MWNVRLNIANYTVCGEDPQYPGHIALWIISLGHQKDAVLQWLGKDELLKHNTVAFAVKYIRSKLMEARSQSEARQDLDAKLTPIRYDEIRHTQAESGKNCSSTFKNAGKYIIIGKTKWEDDSHKARVKRVRVAEPESKDWKRLHRMQRGEESRSRNSY